MITFLITPVKSKRDSLLFETPINKLQFDVAETPVLFDSLSVNQLKKLQSLNDKTNKSSRDSICNLSICGELGFDSLIDNKRLSIISTTNSGDSPSPCYKLFDSSVTPANIFNDTITKIQNDDDINDNNNNNNDDDNDQEEKEKDDILTSTQMNDKWCITMLITKQQLSQQKIYQYLIDNNRNNNKCNINLRNINIIKSCECIPCKHRNWNVVDIKWEKQWQLQQFIFNTDIDIAPYQQIKDVNCDYITNILLTNGIIQKEIFNDSQKTFYRKIMKKGIAPHSNHQITRKKRKIKKEKDRENDKKIILQHLATWSDEYKTSSPIKINNNDSFHDLNDDLNVEYLPLVCKEDNGCSYISCETMMKLLDGTLFDENSEKSFFDYFVIIDCRYDYEYLGGHINGAINVSDKLLIELLFKANMNLRNISSQRIGWIFHCEYSKHRGPQTCKYFRKLDREINEYRYPFISYPHTYVLHGGFKKFWFKYKDSYKTLKNRIFTPYGYVSMWNQLFDDKRFVYSQFRQQIWKKNKLSRKCFD